MIQTDSPAMAVESEAVVISQILNDKQTAFEILSLVEATDFHKPLNRAIFSCTKAALKKSDSMDPESIVAESRTNAGDELALHQVTGALKAPNIAWRQHVDYVLNASLLRKFDTTCTALSEKSRQPGASFDEVRADMMAKLMEAPKKKSQSVFLKQVSPDHLKALEQARERKELPGLAYPFRRINTMTAGMHKGNLILFAGRPSQGKSTVTRTIAVYAASLGIVVDYRSYEDTIDTFIKRTAASLANVPLSVIFDARKMTDEQLVRVKKAYATIAKLPILISDNSDMNIDELFFDVYASKMRHGTELVIQDYLQLLDVPKDRRSKDSRHAEVSYISQSLKRLAKLLQLPVIAVSQLGRDVEKRKSRMPELQDLRDSGSLEQDADLVGLVFRPGFYFQKAEPHDFKIIIAKQRNGPIGTCSIHGDMQIGLLRDKDEELGF